VIAPYYAVLYSKLDRVVQRFGWAATVHGSLTRDLDIVIIPWTEDAEHEDKVVDAIRLFVEGAYITRLRKKQNERSGVKTRTGLDHYSVTEKPHGRRAISIYLGPSGYYLDISIMPRVVKEEPHG